MATFEKCFGMPFPEIWAKKNLLPFSKNEEKALLFGSKIALKYPYLIQGDVPRFIKSCSKGYFLIGFWGHGVNSYAFYYSLADSWRKMFFRLPYGGVYMNNEEQAHLIRNFLFSYMAFEEKIKNKTKELIAIDSMGEGYYKVSYKDGKTYEIKESFLRKPKFDQLVRYGKNNRNRK